MEPLESILTVQTHPASAIPTAAQALVRKRYPEAQVLSTSSSSFDPLRPDLPWRVEEIHGPDFGTVTNASFSDEHGIWRGTEVGWHRATWEGNDLVLLQAMSKNQYNSSTHWVISGVTLAATEGFFADVCKFCDAIHGEILVFEGGCWHPSKRLFHDIQTSSLDDLVLAENLKETILADVQTFLTQEETYQRYRLARKRGILLLGSPGNGKTHLIRGLAKHLKLPVLYVKSFQVHHYGSQMGIRNAFARARKMAPCLFVLEDLDTLVDEEGRSFFLNELDGFASNHGLLTIATCNFPEKLDPAILERPSRFDRKYHFKLPEISERVAYLLATVDRFGADLPLGPGDIESIASKTEDYSFAYLKELLISSVVLWVSEGRERPVSEIIGEQIGTLRSQMQSEVTTQKDKGPSRNMPMGPSFLNEDED